jgi:hypothetical protein
VTPLRNHASDFFGSGFLAGTTKPRIPFLPFERRRPRSETGGDHYETTHPFHAERPAPAYLKLERVSLERIGADAREVCEPVEINRETGSNLTATRAAAVLRTLPRLKIPIA